MTTTATLGIVTVTFNSSGVLDGFLSSLSCQTYRNFILYAVDNASRDDTVDRLNAWNDPRLRIISNTENVGVAEANNQGIMAALSEGCPYVLIINNDIECEADTLETLFSEMERLRCDLIAPKILAGDGVHLWCAGGGFSPLKGYLGFHSGEGELDRGQFDNPRRIQHSPTCCLLVKKRVFDAIGMMDARYFVYMDDADFSFRAWRSGYSMYYTPHATILHKVSSLTGGSSTSFSLRYNTRGHVYFMLKHLGVLRCCFYLPAWQLHLLYKLVKGSMDLREYRIRQRAFLEGISVWNDLLRSHHAAR